MTATAVVIGIGNPFRQDDGIGPAVIERLRAHAVPGLRLIASDGEPAQLLDAWADTELAIAVDAARHHPATPGRIHRLEPRAPAASDLRTATTHGFDLAHAVALAEALDRAPRQLVCYAIEAAQLGYGPDLSPAVRNALPLVVRAVLADVRGRLPVVG